MMHLLGFGSAELGARAANEFENKTAAAPGLNDRLGNWGSPDYESGGQEFESLRARQHLAPIFRAKNTAILRDLQGAELAPILRLCTRASGSLALGHSGDRRSSMRCQIHTIR